MVLEDPPTVTVSDPSKFKAGLPRNDNTLFIVETDPLGWKVNRSFKDFQWLYKCLNGKYPANYVPSVVT